METLYVNYSGPHRTERSAENNHIDRLNMFETHLKPLLESFTNITFLKRVDNSNIQTVYRFKIDGFDNILLSFWFNSPSNTSTTSYYYIGLSKIENVDTWDFNPELRNWSYPVNELTKSESVTDEDGNKTTYYWIEISFYQMYIKDLNNILHVFYCATRTNEYPISAYVFDHDNNEQDVVVAVYSSNAFDSYYDESYTACTLPENVGISFASDTQCLVEDMVLVLNNTFKGILRNLVKIYNNKWNAQTNTSSAGNLIEIDGMRYRQINNRLFVRDY